MDGASSAGPGPGGTPSRTDAARPLPGAAVIASAKSHLGSTQSQAEADWSGFPLFPLEHIGLLSLADLRRTELALGELAVGLRDSEDAGDVALRGYVRKERTLVRERTDELDAAERVAALLESGAVKAIRDLRFDDAPKPVPAPAPKKQESAQPAVAPALAPAPASKPARERVESVATAEEDVRVEALPRKAMHDAEGPGPRPPLREAKGGPQEEEEEETVNSARSAKKHKPRPRVADTTWGKTFVVFSDSSKRRKRQQQEDERKRMLDKAVKRKRRLRREERNKHLEQKRKARQRLKDREAARAKWESERQERVKHAEELALVMKERKLQQKIYKEKLSARSARSEGAAGASASTRADSSGEERECLASAGPAGGAEVVEEDDEEDEAEVLLREAMEEERAANENDADKERVATLCVEHVQDAGAEEEGGQDEEDEDEDEKDGDGDEDDEDKDDKDDEDDVDKGGGNQQGEQESVAPAKEGSSAASVSSPGPTAISASPAALVPPSQSSPSSPSPAAAPRRVLSALPTKERLEAVQVMALVTPRELEEHLHEEHGPPPLSRTASPQAGDAAAASPLALAVPEKEEAGKEKEEEEEEEKEEEEKKEEKVKEVENEEEQAPEEAKEEEKGRLTLLEQLQLDMNAVKGDMAFDLSSFRDNLDSPASAPSSSSPAPAAPEEQKATEKPAPTSTQNAAAAAARAPAAAAAAGIPDSARSSSSSSSSTCTSSSLLDSGDFNEAGAVAQVLFELGGRVTDYSDLYRSLGDIFTIWSSDVVRRSNRALILQETIDFLRQTYASCNRVLGMHVLEEADADAGLREAGPGSRLERWREAASERNFKVVSKARHEVFNIVKEACLQLDSLGIKDEEGGAVLRALLASDIGTDKGTGKGTGKGKGKGKGKEKSCDYRTPMKRLPEGSGAVWNLLWTWSKPLVNRDTLLVWQRLNHFHSARALTRKDLLKSELQKYRGMSKFLADEFELLPDTFILPKEYIQFVDAFSKFGEQCPGRNYWIMKPVGLSRGRGISLVSDIGDVCYGQSVIIQRYLGNPMLLDGYKFDLRIYVLVTSYAPLEAWIYDEGFVRVCTHKYSSDALDMRNLFIHLTNSSIQKLGPNGAGSKATSETISRHKAELHEAGGTKLSLGYLWRRLKAEGRDPDAIKAAISRVILKSLVCVDAGMKPQPNSFELYGYDILLDDAARPWLIEVNSSPSLAQENQLDTRIKRDLIADTIRLVNPVPYDRAALLEVLERRAKDLEASRLRPFSRQPKDAEDEQTRLNRDLTAILHGKRPRKLGELPAELCNYTRICPNEPAFDEIRAMLRKDVPGGGATSQSKKPKRPRNRSRASTFAPPSMAGGRGLQYLAQGCNVSL